MTIHLPAVIYVRISSDKASERAGVERQRKDCHALADFPGWNVVEVFEENDISAHSGKVRSAHRALLEAAPVGAQGVGRDRSDREPRVVSAHRCQDRGMTLPLWLQIVALAIPALVSIFSAVWATRSARKAQAAEHEAARLRALEERVAERKYALYQPFLKSLGDTLTPSRKAQAVKGQEDAMADFQSFVTVWGSDEVVEKFYRFRVASATSPPPLVIMRLMSDFLLAVRRDIAWPSTELDGMHMIAMRINDIDNQPDMRRALTMPLDELFAWQGWTPNFEIRSIGEPTPKGRDSRA